MIEVPRFTTIGEVKIKFENIRNLENTPLPELEEYMEEIKKINPKKEEPYLIQMDDGQFYALYYEEGSLLLNWLAPIMILKQEE